MFLANSELHHFNETLNRLRTACKVGDADQAMELLTSLKESHSDWLLPKFDPISSWLFGKMSQLYKAIDAEERLTGYEKAKEVALRSAITKGHAKVAHAIFDLGFDPSRVFPNNIFNAAVTIGEIELVGKMIRQGFDVNYFEKRSWYPWPSFSTLETAAIEGSIDMVDFLITSGAHPTVTSLTLAATSGRSGAAKMLMRLGVSPHSRDRQGLTPIEQVHRSRITPNNSDMIELLTGGG